MAEKIIYQEGAGIDPRTGEKRKYVTEFAVNPEAEKNTLFAEKLMSLGDNPNDFNIVQRCLLDAGPDEVNVLQEAMSEAKAPGGLAVLRILVDQNRDSADWDNAVKYLENFFKESDIKKRQVIIRDLIDKVLVKKQNHSSNG